MKSELHFSEKAKAVFYEFANFETCAEMTVDQLTSGAIGLSGGNTYLHVFPLWAALNPDCREAEFFPVDERKVPFDDKQSNWGAAHRLFLSKTGRQEDCRNFPDSARTYERLLAERFGSFPPVFDRLFLGVGDDGHTASLFPGGDYLSDRQSAVLETRAPKPPHDRITLGPAALIAARRTSVIIAGEAKRDIVKRIFQKDLTLPIVRILAERSFSELYVSGNLLEGRGAK